MWLFKWKLLPGYWAVLSFGAVYYAVKGGSNFSVYWWNSNLKSAWYFLSCIFMWSCLFSILSKVKISQNLHAFAFRYFYYRTKSRSMWISEWEISEKIVSKGVHTLSLKKLHPFYRLTAVKRHENIILWNRQSIKRFFFHYLASIPFKMLKNRV